MNDLRTRPLGFHLRRAGDGVAVAYLFVTPEEIADVIPGQKFVVLMTYAGVPSMFYIDDAKPPKAVIE